MLTIFRQQKNNQPQKDPEPTGPDRKEDQPSFRPTPSPGIPDLPPRPKFSGYQEPSSKPIDGSTTIGKDLIFDGTVKGSGSIRVEGVVHGTLEVQNEVIIGDGGVVKGDIKAEIVTIEGNLNGNVEARKKITINKTGKMIGDIVSPGVVVASGAVYKGKIDMEAAAKFTQKDMADRTPKPASPVKTPAPQPKPPEPVKPIPGPPPQK